MTKKIFKLFFIAIGLFISCNFQSQKKINQAIYEIRYTLRMNDYPNNTYHAEFKQKLVFNSTASIYSDVVAQEYYRLLANNVDYTMLPNITSKGNTYKKDKNIIVTQPVDLQLFSYSEPQLKWELVKESPREILGFKVFLAKTTTDTGQLFFAWYTPNILFPEGPFRFKGLPGLILEVYNFTKSIYFSATEIRKSTEEIEPLQQPNVIFVKDKKQFLITRDNYLKDPHPIGSDFIIRNKNEMKDKTKGIISQNLLD